MNFKKLNFLLSDFRRDVESLLLGRNEPCEIDAELIELIAFLPLLNLRSFSHLCTLCTVVEKFSKCHFDKTSASEASKF